MGWLLGINGFGVLEALWIDVQERWTEVFERQEAIGMRTRCSGGGVCFVRPIFPFEQASIVET